MPPQLRVVGTRNEHSKRLKHDISSLLASVLRTQPQLTPKEAMFKVEETMLKDNPFVPPKDGTCIINSIPPEVLAHIFRLGVWMDREWNDDEFEEVEDEKERKDLNEELKKLTEEAGDDVGDEGGHGKRSARPKDTVEEDGEEVLDDDDDDPNWEDESSEGEEDEEEEADEDEDEDEDDDEDEDEDEDDGDDTPFEILVSHVCRHWRQTALNTPDIWTQLEFVAPPQWDKYDAYIDRAKGQPLDILIDGSRPRGYDADDHPDHPDFTSDTEAPSVGDIARSFFSSKELRKITDVVVPLAAQWQSIEINIADHEDMDLLLKRLHEIPAAPTLRSLHLHDDEILEEEFSASDLPEAFPLPFHGNAPNLQDVTLWGVHIDWDGAIAMFKGLHELDLAGHIKKPSFLTFSTYLTNSPQLLRLELDGSGPALLDDLALMPVPPTPATPATGLPSAYYTPAPILGDSETNPWEWPRYPFEVPSVHQLVLAHQEPPYALALATKFFFPNIHSLSLNYENGDFTEVIKAYTTPLRGASSRRSMFQSLESLELVDIGYVGHDALDPMLESLSQVKDLSLDCTLYDVDGETAPEVLWEHLRRNVEAVYKLMKATGTQEEEGDASSVPTQEATVSLPSTTGPPPSLAIVPPDPNEPLPTPPATTVPVEGSSNLLANTVAISPHPKLLLPNLVSFRTRDVDGVDLRSFVQKRIKVGAPIKKLFVHSGDSIEDKDERWLREHLEEFDYYSDSEEEEDDDDDDIDVFELSGEEDGEDGDGEWEDDGDEDGEGGEWVDDDDGDDEDEDMGDDGEGEGRVQGTGRVHSARAGRGAASTRVTTGLSNLD